MGSQYGPKEKKRKFWQEQLGGENDQRDRAGEQRGKVGEHPLFATGRRRGWRRSAGCDGGQMWARETQAVTPVGTAEAVDAEDRVWAVASEETV